MIDGEVTTTGANSTGIVTAGWGETTMLSGSITTKGDNATGIYITASQRLDRVKTILSGSITAAGHGIHIATSTGNHEVDISGTVNSMGTTYSALLNSGSGTGNKFTLNEGAVIIGNITNNSQSTQLAINLGQNESYAYSLGGTGIGTTTGKWSITDEDGRTPAVSENGSCVTGVFICNLCLAPSDWSKTIVSA